MVVKRCLRWIRDFGRSEGVHLTNCTEAGSSSDDRHGEGGGSTGYISIALCVGVTLWAGCTTAGILALVSYTNSSGSVGVESLTWPETAGFDCSRERHTLVMFAHPRCPCSRASIEQLARIHARCRDSLEIRVLFYCPSDQPALWAQTGVWYSAEKIPGALIAIDLDGGLAERFGARTSGHVALYDTVGELVFSGGITAGRGAEGDNIGTSAVIACVRGERPQHVEAPVFGCCIPSKKQVEGARQTTPIVPIAKGDPS